MGQKVNNYPDTDLKNGMFNQAFFQMQRLNDLLSRTDRLFINPLEFNSDFNAYNFEIIARDYQSIFFSIYAKLTPDEQKKLKESKTKVFILLRNRPPFKVIKKIGFDAKKVFIAGRWDNINKELFTFRTLLEEGMEAHGLGNPNKSTGGAAMLEI